MDSQFRAGLVFHLTGRRADGGTAESMIAGLRPALMARHRDLESLRYDFPLVLAGEGGDYVRPLSGLVDEALHAVAPAGAAGEARRRRALRVEREIRRLKAAGAQGTLTELWDRAAGDGNIDHGPLYFSATLMAAQYATWHPPVTRVHPVP